MNFESITGNVIAAFIYAGIVYFLKAAFRFIKKSESEVSPKKTGKKAVIRKQFFVALLIFVIAFAVYCSIGFHPIDSRLVSLRIICGLASGVSFLAIWGAFDAAFAFYPDDDTVEIQADQDPQDRTR